MRQMTQLDTPDRESRAHDRPVTTSKDMLWITAALVESLTLVGGLLWILNGPAGVALPWRIALVVFLAVLGGAGFVYAASACFRPRD